MKTFKITWTKYGNCCNYNQETVIRAGTEKVAWKKFWNYRSTPGGRTREQSFEYDRYANGIGNGNFQITEVVG